MTRACSINRRFTLVIALFFATFCLSISTSTADSEVQTEERHVAILSVSKSFDAALADAKKISTASKMPFSMEDRIYDKKHGIILPAAPTCHR